MSIEHIFIGLAEEKKKVLDSLVQGVASYEVYLKLVGVHQGLEIAESILEQIITEANRDKNY